jgi:hypothetical protein
MRKFMQNNILSLLSTIATAAAYGLYDDCQAGFNAAQSMIKENLSEKAFKKYENKFNITNIDMLANLLKTEPEVKKEIVFFPYKVSMWDSLKSVWLAAKKDASCYVSVVPIPYYVVENDKTVFCYEGDLYPDYVQIADWQKYDETVLLPDAAYIHNAYDDRNLVTRVHPRFFTRNLKKYVDKLIYIPYYASDSRPGPAFATIAVGSLADIMVASSEIDKQAYRLAGVNFDIAVLGSPKIDRILIMGNEKPVMPATWGNLSGKKIFFLNTSVASMLNKPEFYFEKLAILFELFKERDDIALIWRPHPLTKATINSLRPNLKEAYNKIEIMINEGSFGILDETPDMGLAMALSHAYIGDGGSSLVYLYSLTGKPVFLLNFKLPAQPDYELRDELLHSDIVSWGVATQGSNEWGVCASVNALCKVKPENLTAWFVSSFPDEPNVGGLYLPPVKLDGKLLFAPALARSWAFYDINSGLWEKKPIPEETMPELDKYTAFGGGVRWMNKIIFLPGASGITAVYNMETDEFTYYGEIAQRFKNHISNLDWGFVSGCCADGNLLYIPSCQCNIITELNMETMTFNFYEVGAAKNRYRHIMNGGGTFWLTKFREHGLKPWQEGIISWDKETGNVHEYTDLPINQARINLVGSGFSCTFYSGGFVYAFPNQADAIIKINPQTGTAERLELDPYFDYFERKSSYYTWGEDTAISGVYSLTDNKATVFVPYDYSMITIDLATGKYNNRMKWRVEGIENLKAGCSRLSPTPWLEDTFLTPKDFINKVIAGDIPAYDEAQVEFYKKANVNSDGSCGVKVHEYVMNAIA